MGASLTAAMEDYLELIYTLGKNGKVVRVRDIAREMNVRMPSVTSMLNKLSSRDLIIHEKYEYVELTQDGAGIAREINLQHQIIFNFLTNVLKIDSKTADQDACKMEHAVSPITLKRLVEFMEFTGYYRNSQAKEDPIKRIKESVK